MRTTRVGAAALVFALLACGPAEEKLQAPPGYRRFIDGLSPLHMQITATPIAQKYFDQGMRLVYAFNHDEAIRAFQAGQKLDPSCAMCWWGEALALGPNINLTMDPGLNARAVDALANAEQRKDEVSAREQAFIAALAKRYSAAPDAKREDLDKAYADAMRELAKQYPKDPDAQTLFAEALMDLTPWAYWTKDGQPTRYTGEIVAALEAVIAADPKHPGANHYYIHAVEASREPGKALASAKLLDSLAPEAGHLVHMPAHTYMRVGDYAAASRANARGAEADEAYTAWCKSGGYYPTAYYPHNLHFLWASQAMEGRSADSLATARKLAENLPPEAARAAPPAMELFAIRYFAPVRFGAWEAILAEPAPPDDLRYPLAIWHFARGMALANTGKLDEAQAEHAAVTALAGEDALRQLEFLEGPASMLVEIAGHLLAAEIASKQGRSDVALTELEQARATEYALKYTEPPPWPISVRHYQGAALLAAGRAADAEVVFREDLVEYPENGWALYGLAESLKAQQKDASEVDKRFATAWAASDVKLSRSRF